MTDEPVLQLGAQQDSYSQGYKQGVRYAQMHPRESTLAPRMAGVYAVAHLKEHALPLRPYFLRGFLEGFRAAPR